LSLGAGCLRFERQPDRGRRGVHQPSCLQHSAVWILWSKQGNNRRKRKWIDERTTSAPVLTALRSLQDIPRLSTKTSHKDHRLNHCLQNVFWFVTALTKIFMGHVTVAFTITARPLEPKCSLIVRPPLHCRCRSRARACLRNRHRGPSRMGRGGQVREPPSGRF
jgi:hypothetical protein